MGRPGASEAESTAAAAAAAAAFIAALPEGYATLVGPRRAPVRRPAPARRPGPRPAARPAHPAARRGHQRARRRERGGGAGRAGPRCASGAPRSSWRTGCPPCATPTWWWRMADGRAVEQGTHADLLAGEALYCAPQYAGRILAHVVPLHRGFDKLAVGCPGLLTGLDMMKRTGPCARSLRMLELGSALLHLRGAVARRSASWAMVTMVTPCVSDNQER